MRSSKKNNLIVILGPTAVGKTEIAIQLAERLEGEIVSADSRTFYRGLTIGTAKPSFAKQARVPHHMVDIAELDETLSLAEFQARARQAIAGIHSRGHLPFLVGGTGQYIRAVIQGWQPPEVAPNPRLRAALESWVGEIGKEALHNRLAVLDPQAAAAIDPRNLRRTVRALEVILTTGQRFSTLRTSSPSQFCLLLLGLNRPRAELYARIDARITTMLQDGLVGEIKGLLDQGYAPNLPSLSAIGYREIVAFLGGETTLEEAVVQIKRATRVFVRRQANWFKPNDPQIHWFQVGLETVNQMEAFIREWLA